MRGKLFYKLKNIFIKMSNRVNLSSAFNTSLGFIPVIVSIILCGFTTANTAIYIGAIIGIAYSILSYFLTKERIHNFILYSTTGVLCLISILALLSNHTYPVNLVPISLQIAVTLPLLVIYMNKNRILIHYIKRDNKRAIQAAESSFITIRVVLILILIHFALITLSVLFTRSVDNTFMWILLAIFPGLIFIGSIIINQIGLNLFNKTMAEVRYVPIINEKGTIIGKIIETEIPPKQNEIIIPVVRIAVEYQGMLYLSECDTKNVLCEKKIDIPMETVLYYKETLEDGVTRLLQETFPTATKLKPRFNLKYHIKNDDFNRVVFLFMLSLKNDSVLSESKVTHNSKLWTLQQIEQNLDKNYFSKTFEYEYDHLKTVIDTIKKYKES